MAKGIEARLKALESGMFSLYTQVARLKATVFGTKDEAPKARKPRKPRGQKALGRHPLDPHGIGAIPATDPRYGDADKAQAEEEMKGRGRRKKAEPGDTEEK